MPQTRAEALRWAIAERFPELKKECLLPGSKRPCPGTGLPTNILSPEEHKRLQGRCTKCLGNKWLPRYHTPEDVWLWIRVLQEAVIETASFDDSWGFDAARLVGDEVSTWEAACDALDITVPEEAKGDSL